MTDKVIGLSIDVILVANPSTNEIIDNQFYPRSIETPNKDKVELSEDYKDDEQKHKAPQSPMVITDSGPIELNNTRSFPPPNQINIIGNNAVDMYEVCPYCDNMLHIYGRKDVITGDKIYRCKICHGELVKTNRGWDKP